MNAKEYVQELRDWVLDAPAGGPWTEEEIARAVLTFASDWSLQDLYIRLLERRLTKALGED